MKGDNAKMKLESNVHGVRGEMADGGNLGSATVGDTLNVQLEEFREGQLMDVNEENGCDKEEAGVP